MNGPQLWLKVLTTEMKPMTAVLSPGCTTIDRNAALGAMSIDARDDLITRKVMAPVSEDGIGIRARAMAEGR